MTANGRLGKLVPIQAFLWLRHYEKPWLRFDTIAAVTLAAYLLPAALGDASLANLPPQMGLYACLFGGLVFWLFCSSHYTSISVTSAISLLMGSTLGGIAEGNVARFASLAETTAILVALIAFLAWLFKAGAVVNFISESVMTGFKCGVALFLASTQLPKLFGFPAAHGSFWHNCAHFFKHLNETNSAALVTGAIALAVLVLGKLFLRNKPVGLLVVIAGIMSSSFFALEARGVKLLGKIPQGLPPLGLPRDTLSDFNQLLPLALACFLLAAVETAAIGRMFAAKHGNRIDANQEFFALGFSNLMAALGRGFPISGGMSQSLVNEDAGARSPLSTAFAAGILILVVCFFSHLLSALPQPVLAAIVLSAVASLFKLSTLKELWRGDRPEFFAAMGALLGVMTSGLLRGVLIGSVISLVQVLTRASKPHIGELGRIPGTHRFSDRLRHPDNESIPGVHIFRPESGLVYFNIDNVCDTIRNRIAADEPPPKLVIVDLSAAPRIDLQSAHALANLASEIASKGICFHAVEARSSVRDCLRKQGVDDKLGGISRLSSVSDAIEEFDAAGNRQER